MMDASNDLIASFPNSFINEQGEFIADRHSNVYFSLKTCKDEMEVRCKVLEYLSRDACKTEPFRFARLNDEYHDRMLNGINDYLGTQFTTDNMETIYTRIGNGINKELTLKFLQSGYDLKTLEG